tara:strand:- start:669 stop:920 length:252 start_codon:yes stop_codon:yes gene_type:complete
MISPDQKFEEQLKAWGEKNPWFTNPETDLELEMAIDAASLHTQITESHGVPNTERGVDLYLALIDAGIRKAYPEYAWEKNDRI